jgi:hypothetical protein
VLPGTALEEGEKALSNGRRPPPGNREKYVSSAHVKQWQFFNLKATTP